MLVSPLGRLKVAVNGPRGQISGIHTQHNPHRKNWLDEPGSIANQEITGSDHLG